MVDAAEPHADDEDDGQAELFGKVGRVAVRAERYTEAADTFDQHGVGQAAQCVERIDDAVDVDRASFLDGGDVRRDGRRDKVGPTR